MGNVRTKTIKRAARDLVEKYYQRLTLDVCTNKRLCDEIADIQTKKLRNKIAGYTTHFMKRIQKGPVRGISLKLQEEERERRMDFIPEKSAVDVEEIEVDKVTLEMLQSIGMGSLPGVTEQQYRTTHGDGERGRGGGGGDRGGRGGGFRD